MGLRLLKYITVVAQGDETIGVFLCYPLPLVQLKREETRFCKSTTQYLSN